jgi:hypothetical protein
MRERRNLQTQTHKSSRNSAVCGLIATVLAVLRCFAFGRQTDEVFLRFCVAEQANFEFLSLEALRDAD